MNSNLKWSIFMLLVSAMGLYAQLNCDPKSASIQLQNHTLHLVSNYTPYKIEWTYRNKSAKTVYGQFDTAHIQLLGSISNIEFLFISQQHNHMMVDRGDAVYYDNYRDIFKLNPTTKQFDTLLPNEYRYWNTINNDSNEVVGYTKGRLNRFYFRQRGSNKIHRYDETTKAIDTFYCPHYMDTNYGIGGLFNKMICINEDSILYVVDSGYNNESIYLYEVKTQKKTYIARYIDNGFNNFLYYYHDYIYWSYGGAYRGITDYRYHIRTGTKDSIKYTYPPTDYLESYRTFVDGQETYYRIYNWWTPPLFRYTDSIVMTNRRLQQKQILNNLRYGGTPLDTLDQVAINCNGDIILSDLTQSKTAYTLHFYKIPKKIDTTLDLMGLWCDTFYAKVHYHDGDSLVLAYTIPPPPPFLPKDTIICLEDSIPIVPNVSPNAVASYQWSNGSHTPIIRGVANNVYRLEITDTMGCVASDSIWIAPHDAPTFPTVPSTLWLHCDYPYVLLHITTPLASQYYWSDGSTDSIRKIEAKGLYTFHIEHPCGQKTDSILVEKDLCDSLFDINAFSPNGDGINDFFEPKMGSDIIFTQFLVYNRFGETIYQTNTTIKWDGRYKGEPQPVGTYLYYMEYYITTDKQKKIKKGTLNLL